MFAAAAASSDRRSAFRRSEAGDTDLPSPISSYQQFEDKQQFNFLTEFSSPCPSAKSPGIANFCGAFCRGSLTVDVGANLLLSDFAVRGWGLDCGMGGQELDYHHPWGGGQRVGYGTPHEASDDEKFTPPSLFRLQLITNLGRKAVQ